MQSWVTRNLGSEDIYHCHLKWLGLFRTRLKSMGQIQGDGLGLEVRGMVGIGLGIGQIGFI